VQLFDGKLSTLYIQKGEEQPVEDREWYSSVARLKKKITHNTFNTTAKRRQ
jgi:hypothetical protein